MYFETSFRWPLRCLILINALRSTSLSLTTNRYNLFSNCQVVPVVAVAVPDVVSVVTITADVDVNVVMLLLLLLLLFLMLLLSLPLLRLLLVMLNISDNIF